MANLIFNTCHVHVTKGFNSMKCGNVSGKKIVRGIKGLICLPNILRLPF